MKIFFFVLILLSTPILKAQSTPLRKPETLLFETLLKTGVTQGVKMISNPIAQPIAEVGVKVAVALFDRYMQYDDFIKKSEQKITKLEKQQNEFMQQMTASQKQLIDQVESISTRQNQMDQKLDKIDQNLGNINIKINDIEKKVDDLSEKINILSQKDQKDIERKLKNATNDLTNFFISYQHPIADHLQQEARNDLKKIRDQFAELRNHDVFTKRKDLQALTLVSLATIEKLLNNHSIAFQYMVQIVEIPLLNQQNDKTLKSLDQFIKQANQEIKLVYDPNETANKIQKRDILQEEYTKYKSATYFFKLQDHYVIDLQEEIKALVKDQYTENSPEYQAIKNAEQKALYDTDEAAEAQTLQIVKNMLSRLR